MPTLQPFLSAQQGEKRLDALSPLRLQAQASAAALARVLDGKPAAATLAEAQAAVESVLAGGSAPAPWDAFAPVARHKSRHDCVKLPFSAVKSLFSGT